MPSIERRPNGWRTVWSYQGKKEQTIQWPTIELAERAFVIAALRENNVTAREVEQEILGDEPEEAVVQAQVDAEPTAPTLAEWFDKWIEAKTRITPRTRAGYKRLFELRINKELGHVRLDEITPTLIGRAINKWRTGLSNKTLTRYFSVLSSCLQGAVKEKRIPENPCGLTDFVRDQVEDDDTGEEGRVYLTPYQFHLFRGQFSADGQLVVETFAESGGRWSEVTALAVKHLVAPTPEKGPGLKIWRAWKQDEDGGWYLGTTKGRQKRTVGISVDLYERLLANADGRSPEDLLLTAPKGGRVLYNNFVRRHWVPALVRGRRCSIHPPANQAKTLPGATGRCSDFGGRRSDHKPCESIVVDGTTRCANHQGPAPDAVSTCACPDVLHVAPTPHDLRHSHAAWLFADPDVAPLAISRRLGHANLQTTSEIYGGLMPSAEESAVSAITRVMEREGATKLKEAKPTRPKHRGQRPAAQSPGQEGPGRQGRRQ